MSKFRNDMKKAKGTINSAIEKAIRGASLELFGEIVKRTPVGNPSLWKNTTPPKDYRAGTLRGNWQANLNSPDTSVLETPDANGGSTINRAKAPILGYTLNDNAIYFSNNLPYAESVEKGSSKQRPEGMVRTTVDQFRPIMEKIAIKYKV